MKSQKFLLREARGERREAETREMRVASRESRDERRQVENSSPDGECLYEDPDVPSSMNGGSNSTLEEFGMTNPPKNPRAENVGGRRI